MIYKENIDLPKEFPVSIYKNKVTLQNGKKDIEEKQGEYGDNYKSSHYHRCLEITYIIEGEGFYEVNGNIYSISSGDIIIFNSLEPHSWWNGQNQMLVQGILFDPIIVCSGSMSQIDYLFLSAFNERSTTFSNKLPSTHLQTKHISNLISEIEQEFEDKMAGYRLMIKTKLLNILTLLMRHFIDKNKEASQIKKKSLQLDALKGALSYIEKYYGEELRLERLSKIAHMNSSYFSVFFKKTLGLSPVEYITRVRLGKADELIKSTNRTLLDISQECGFNSISNFYRVYVRIFNRKPSETRKP